MHVLACRVLARERPGGQQLQERSEGCSFPAGAANSGVSRGCFGEPKSFFH